mmetsp:Transcript_14825/g.33354  ORF Transcript_14825/g.33354 Transcript_14825/m.33354 type:complete len:691 (+) Transcript_14825:76-2148(+)
MKSSLFALLLVLGITSVNAVEASTNPIRRVVRMLQSMTEKIEAEAAKEKEMYEKYMCYCKTSTGTLQESISTAETKIPKVEAALEEAKSQKASLEQQLKDHKYGRKDAAEAIANSESIREKEAAEFTKESAELTANIDALTKAIDAISTGMGSFLQTGSAQAVRRLAVNSANLASADRDILMSFLDQGSSSGYASGQIVGILKVMKDEMEKDLAEMTEAEEAAQKNQAELKAAKEKELAAHTKAIEEKTARVGKLGVEIAEKTNDLEDTEEALAEDQKFLADMDENCATKDKEWEAIEKKRAEEKLALAETIKILNDDDALELFKKTLPSPAKSFVQVQVTSKDVSNQALSVLRALPAHSSQLNFLMLALSGKKVGFEKVLTMIDEMVALLKKEQVDDDTKKATCAKDFDTADDEKKALEKTLSDLEKSIDVTTDDLTTVTEEIKALKDAIKALDKSVAEATETRKEEHAEFQELMASDAAAKELLFLARNRLAKFYNPKLYKPPPEKVLTEEEKIEAAFNDTALLQGRVAPPPPPETWGAYKKKMEGNNGVLAMMDLLVKDLEKEMTEAEAEEKNSQADYEKTMEEAATTRAEDSKSLTNKDAAKAELEESLETSKEDKKATGKELKAKEEYIESLHGECDWLLKYSEQRQAARAEEVDALGRAKAILSGADYSLVQTQARHRVFLHRA